MTGRHCEGDMLHVQLYLVASSSSLVQGGGAVLVTGVHRAPHADEGADQLGLAPAGCIGQRGHACSVTHIHSASSLLKQLDDHHVAARSRLQRRDEDCCFLFGKDTVIWKSSMQSRLRMQDIIKRDV